MRIRGCRAASSGKRKPALAEQLKALHKFEEDLREGLEQETYYNQSLGTVSTFYLYDRPEGSRPGRAQTGVGGIERRRAPADLTEPCSPFTLKATLRWEKMKTYNFKVVLEPDEDFDGNPSGWHAYCPALQGLGGSTWGETREEALKHINEVVHMIVRELAEEGRPLPEWPELKQRSIGQRGGASAFLRRAKGHIEAAG